MDVGLETRVARSPRLMALTVSGVVKTNEGRTVKLSLPPPPPKPLGNYAKMTCDHDRPSLVMWIWLVQVGRRNECNRQHSTVLFSCWRPGGEFVFNDIKIFMISVNCEWSDVKKHQEMWENSTEGAAVISKKYHKQQPRYNTLELLMMGIVMPETCWASNKICK